MYKKLISCILVAAFLNLVGCYSYKAVTMSDYQQIEDEEDIPDNIYVVTKDDKEYKFKNSNFYFENDTLFGKQKVKTYFHNGQYKSEKLVDINIALSNIKSMKANIYNSTATTLLIGAIALQVVGIIIVFATWEGPSYSGKL